MKANDTRVTARFAPETRLAVKPTAAGLRASQESELERLKKQLLSERLARVNQLGLTIPLQRAANEAAALAWVTQFPCWCSRRCSRKRREPCCCRRNGRPESANAAAICSPHESVRPSSGDAARGESGTRATGCDPCSRRRFLAARLCRRPTARFPELTLPAAVVAGPAATYSCASAAFAFDPVRSDF